VAKARSTQRSATGDRLLGIASTVPVVGAILAVAFGLWLLHIPELIDSQIAINEATARDIDRDATHVTITGHWMGVVGFAAGAVLSPLLIALVRRERGVPMRTEEPPEG